MTTHCGALIPKSEHLDHIDLTYFFYYLSYFLKKYAIGDTNKRLTVDRMSDVRIFIPYKDSGEIDIYKQKAISEKFKKTETIKKMLHEKFNRLFKTSVYFY
ncbi:restriction endonuclease subunit S [bacterium]|nr:restriction endonuclease subunit S [bacterium]